MQYTLNLFKKDQPSDLEALENTVNYTNTSTVDLLDSIDWDIQQAHDAGDTQRVHELITIKNDMN
tara:strand:+ start:907 stop:1101 length:195 start_codon:yes stop_codon:yes gene_type:complete